jgi:hypothetical protein
MSRDPDPKAISHLQSDLLAAALGIFALAWLVYRAQSKADDVRRQLLLERRARGQLAEERDRAKADLDGALEKLHEVMENGKGQDPAPAPEPERKPPARPRTSRAKST